MAKILAIDDDSMILETFELIVETLMPEHQVISATNGKDGIEKAIAEDPALILLDISMPVMDGFEVCRLLKDDDRTRRIPIVIVTGMNANRAMKAKVLDVGADAFLNKPFDNSELIAQIRAMLRIRETERLLTEERDKLKRIVRDQSFELDRNNERWSLVLQSTNDGVWDWNIQTNEAFFSDHWFDALGYKPNELPYNFKTFFNLIFPEDHPRVRKAIQDYLGFKSATFQIELRMLCKSGETKWFLYRGQCVWDENNKPIRMVGTQSDITDRKGLESKLIHIANHDSLTGLPNRSLFLDRLTQAVARSHRFKSMTAVLFIDLDGFKPVNDTYGHKVGDVLLAQAAARFRSCVRKLDTVARLGGDEFLVILADIKDENDVRIIAARIVEEIAKKFVISGNEIRISSSVGISVYPNDSHDEETLIKFADSAMYAVKQHGKGHYRFYSNRFIDTERVLTVSVQEIRNGLTNHDFHPYYQPVLSGSTGPWFALETTLILHTHQMGVLGPDVFLMSLDDDELYHRIETFHWSAICRDLKKWRQSGEFPGKILLRVSSKQFYQLNFVEELSGVFRECQGLMDRILLAISEDVILHDIEFAQQIGARIKDLGIDIVIDNFGLGHISLYHLSRFPAWAIRLSPTLIGEMNRDEKQMHLVRTITNFAHSMGLKVMATGIESGVQAASADALGFDYVQGPHFIDFAGKEFVLKEYHKNVEPG